MVQHATNDAGNSVKISCDNKGCLKVKNINNIISNISFRTAKGISVYADTLPLPIRSDNNDEGWLYKKVSTGPNKFNYYFYGQGNTPMTLADLTSIKANATIETYIDTTSIPFFNVYTKPTGVGDAGAWYHSKISYSLSPNQKIFLGEPIQLWGGVLPKNQYNIRQVEFNSKITTGEALPTEELLTISLGSDSGAAANGVNILVSQLGLEFGEINLVSNLVA